MRSARSRPHRHDLVFTRTSDILKAMTHGIQRNKQIEFWVARIRDLPTLPSVVHQTIKVLNNPNSSIRQISDTLSQDLSLATRVLRLANSSYYALPGGATTIDRAVTALGIDNVSQMVFTAAVFSQFELETKLPFNVREFWRHSLGVAIASETIAREIGTRDTSMIYLAGLIHDIGKLAHYQIAKEEWLLVCNHARLQGITILESEKALGFVTHDELGYELVRHWQLPLMIQEAVQMHHDAGLFSAAATMPSFYSQAVGIVSLANLLVHSMHFGHSGHNIVRNPSKDLVKRVLGNENALIHVAKSTRKALDRITPLFETIFGPEPGT